MIRSGARRLRGAHVVVRDPAIAEWGASGVHAPFLARPGGVEAFPGDLRLETSSSSSSSSSPPPPPPPPKDEAHPGTYRMMTWWESEAHPRGHLRSQQHRRSHARIRVDPARAPGGRPVRSLVCD